MKKNKAERMIVPHNKLWGTLASISAIDKVHGPLLSLERADDKIL